MSTQTATKTNIFTLFIKDIFLGWTIKEAIFAWFLIGIQLVTFIFNPDSIAGFITGMTGTICVLLVAKRRMSNYIFGIAQTAIALYLGLKVNLIGESIENGFYFISQFLGIMAWRKHMVQGTGIEKDVEEVVTRKFTLTNWILTLATIAIATLALGYAFSQMNGTQPYVDALTTAIAGVAQIIMLKRYREQWVFWFALNLVSLIQWFTLGNMSIVALYTAMIINNAYGYYQWSKGIA